MLCDTVPRRAMLMALSCDWSTVGSVLAMHCVGVARTSSASTATSRLPQPATRTIRAIVVFMTRASEGPDGTLAAQRPDGLARQRVQRIVLDVRRRVLAWHDHGDLLVGPQQRVLQRRNGTPIAERAPPLDGAVARP